MLKHFLHHWFLWALLAILVGGITWPTALAPWSAHVPRRPIVAMVLFLMAFPLELSALTRVIQRPLPGILAIGLNMGLIPCCAWLVSHWFPSGLAEGLIIASAVPCTLASAAVWTNRAGGNDAIALLVMIVTNLACFLVTPTWIYLLLGARVSIPFGSMVAELAWLVGLPILLAQSLRYLPRVAAWATGHKTTWSAAAQCGILSIVVVGAVQSGNQIRHAGGSVFTLADGALLLAGVLSIHLAVLGIGWGTARALAISRPDAIAIAFAGSQKTLMVGLYVAIQFGGLAVLPMVAYHVGQLVVDTVIADYWRRAAGP